jgi:quercetin dioxygenase-like cupin family protein
MSKQVRRIVTGHDPEGRSVVKWDATLPRTQPPTKDAYFSLVWTTAKSPADNNDESDGAQRAIGLTSDGGSVCRVVETLPGKRSPMHRTRSVDYGIVIQGRIDMELDDGSLTPLAAGDVVVQRGTNHAWVNNYDEPALIAFVLVDAKPLVINGKTIDPSH